MALFLGELYFQIGARTKALKKAEQEARKFVETVEKAKQRGGKASKKFERQISKQAATTERAMRRASQATGRFSRKARRDFMMASAAAGAFRAVAAGLALFLGVEMVRRTIMMADTFDVMERRLRTATRATGEYKRVSKELLDIVSDIGTHLEPSVKVYQDLERVRPEIGATTQGILNLTRAVNQLGVISGADANAIRFGLRQFSQGLSMGVFRAEEMNSLLENIPEVAARIAKGLGMSTGELRLQVLEGKILSQQVYESLAKQSHEINEEFKELPLTIDRAWVMMQVGAMQFLDTWNEAAHFTSTIAKGMESIANWMRGDFTKSSRKFSLFLVEGQYALEQWWGLFKDIMGGLGVTEQSLKTFLSYAQSFAAAMWDGFVKAPEKIREWSKGGWDAFEEWWQKQLNSSKAFELKLVAMAKRAQKAMWETEDSPTALSNVAKLTAEIEELEAAIKKLEGRNPFAKFQTSSRIDRAGGTAGQMSELDKRLAAERRSHWLEDLDKWSDFDPPAAIAAFNAENKRKADARIAERNAKEEQERLDKLLKTRIDKLKESLESKIKLEQKNHAKTLKDLSRALEIEYITEKEFNYLKFRETARHLAAMDKLKAERAKRFSESQGDVRADRAQLGAAEWNRHQYLSPKLAAVEEELKSEHELERERYAQQLDLINQAEAAGLAATMSYQEMKERALAEHLERMKKISEDATKKITNIEMAARLFQLDFEESVHKDSLRASAKQFEEQIEVAARHSRQFFSIQKAIALASAVVEGHAATLSAYAHGTKIGGPVLGAVFAGVAAAATAAQIAGISQARYTGGRRSGGAVGPGRMYEVNESGMEMLSAGGKDYLLTGDNSGNITPADKVGGMGSNVVVNVYPLQGQTAKVEQRQTQNGTEIDVIVEQLDRAIADGIQRGGSEVSDALERRYGLNRAAGGR